MRTELQSDLDALEAGFQEIGEVVSRAIRGAVDALRTQDVELFLQSPPTMCEYRGEP